MNYHPDLIPSTIFIPLIPQVTDGSWELGDMARELGALVGAKIVVKIYIFLPCTKLLLLPRC